MEQTTRLQFRNQIEKVTNLVKENFLFAQEIEQQLGDWVDIKASIHDFQVLQDNLVNNRFELVVIGEFSTGKSTFINAIVGKKVLPSKAQPTTATVNYIVHASQHPEQKEEAVIYFENGSQKSVPFSELEDYVSEMSKKIKVVEEIKYVNIYIDSPYLEDGVIIVDTPGMESLHVKHDEITKKQIRRSNASIFLFDINRAGSRTEFEFISDVYGSIDRIFFVANRSDEVNLEEQTIAEVVESIEGKLQDNPYHKVSKDHAKVYPVSALKALNSRIPGNSQEDGQRAEWLRASEIVSFENRLWDYLTKGEKVNELLTNPLNRIERFYEDVVNQLANKLAVVKGEVDFLAAEREIERLQESIESRKLALSSEKATIMRTIRDLIDSSEEKFEKKMELLSAQLQSQLTNYEDLDTFKSDLDRLNERIKSRYLSEAESFLKMMKRNVLRTVLEHIRVNEEQLAAELNADRLDLNINVGLRMVQKSDHTELAFLKESLQKIEEDTQGVREKMDAIDEKIGLVQHNELVEDELNQLYNRYEARRGELNSRLQGESYYLTEEAERERKGAGKILTWFGVPEKMKKVTMKNPRVEKWENDLARLEKDFETKLSQIEGRKSEAKGSSQLMKQQLEKLEGKEDKLRGDFQNIRNQIMKKILDNQKEEIQRMNKEIIRAIQELTIGVKQQYHELIDTLNVESVVSKMVNQYYEEQDSIIKNLTAELEKQNELVNKSEQEQRVIESQLTQIQKRIEEKKIDLHQLKEGRSLAAIK